MRWMTTTISWRAMSLPPFLMSARVNSVRVRPLGRVDREEKEEEEEEEAAAEEEATGPDDATWRPRLKLHRRPASAAGAGTLAIDSAMCVTLRRARCCAAADLLAGWTARKSSSHVLFSIRRTEKDEI